MAAVSSPPAGDMMKGDNASMHAAQAFPREEASGTKQRTKANAKSEAQPEETLHAVPPASNATSRSTRHWVFRAFRTMLYVPLVLMIRLSLPFVFSTLLTSVTDFFIGYHAVMTLLVITKLIRPTALAFIPRKTLARSVGFWVHLRNVLIGAAVLGSAVGLYFALFTLVVYVDDKIQIALGHRTSIAEEPEIEEEQPVQLSRTWNFISIFVGRSARYMMIVAEVIALPFGNQLAAWYTGEKNTETSDMWLALVIGLVGTAARIGYIWRQQIQKRKAAKTAEAASASDTGVDTDIAAQAKEAAAEKTSNAAEESSMV